MEDKVMENVVEEAVEVVEPIATSNNKIVKLIALGGAIVTGVIGAIVVSKKRKHYNDECSVKVETNTANDEVKNEEYVED